MRIELGWNGGVSFLAPHIQEQKKGFGLLGIGERQVVLFRGVVFEVVELHSVIFKVVMKFPVARTNDGAWTSAEEGVAGLAVVLFVCLQVDGEVPIKSALGDGRSGGEEREKIFAIENFVFRDGGVGSCNDGREEVQIGDGSVVDLSGLNLTLPRKKEGFPECLLRSSCPCRREGERWR